MGKKILVVDDSWAIRNVVTEALEAAGFEAIQAVDGIEGACKINNTDDLAAVVTDINMPRMSGLEMIRKVKADLKNTTLPIIVLTTEGQAELVVQARSYGAKAWMVKPFKPELLVMLVQKLVLG